MIIDGNTCRMLNNNKTESRNFANQPFSSNSTFHRVSRDSPFFTILRLRNRGWQLIALLSRFAPFFPVQRIKQGEKYLYKTIRYPVLFIRGGISQSINHREATYRKLILTPASLHYSSTVLIVIRVVEFKKGREKEIFNNDLYNESTFVKWNRIESNIDIISRIG